MISGVIFDMDGLMTDTEQLYIGLWCRILREQGMEEHREVVTRCIGMDHGKMRTYITETMGADFDYLSVLSVVEKRSEQYCRENGIFLELCPTSNLQTKAVLQWSDYPFRLFMTEGLGVTVNTDNRTVSQTTMREEYELLRRHCGMTPEDEAMIYQNSIAAAFADDHVKNELLKYVI